MYAQVIVEISAKAVDKMFTYQIPKSMKDIIKIGARVKVPFGHQSLEGFVLKITNTIEENYELKEILELVDEQPILNEEMLKLGKEISNQTLCTLISAYQAMLPKALKASANTNIKIKQDKYIVLTQSKEKVEKYISICRYQHQIELLKELINTSEKKINKVDSTIKTLIKKNMIKIELRESYRYQYQTKSKDK